MELLELSYGTGWEADDRKTMKFLVKYSIEGKTPATAFRWGFFLSNNDNLLPNQSQTLLSVEYNLFRLSKLITNHIPNTPDISVNRLTLPAFKIG